MRHEKRFASLTVYTILAITFFSLCVPGTYLSKLAETIAPSPAFASSEPKNQEKTDVLHVSEGKASYYASRFQGRKTANGETFNMHELTAAHRFLPFGTWVRVTNLKNGRNVIVRINDRGPFIKGRVIDLSKGAAKRIGLEKSGIAQVRIEAINEMALEAHAAG